MYQSTRMFQSHLSSGHSQLEPMSVSFQFRSTTLINHFNLPSNFQDPRSNEACCSSRVAQPCKDGQAGIAPAINTQNLTSDRKRRQSSKRHKHPASGEVSSVVLSFAHLAHADRAETQIGAADEAKDYREDDDHCSGVFSWQPEC